MPLGERYELGEILAEASSGTTLRAIDRQTNQEVVLECLPVARLSDWKSLEHFERRSKLLRALKHPGIPVFVDAFEDEYEGSPAFFIVSRRVEGESLQAQIDRGARWSNQQARDLLKALLETLEHLHALSPRVIHGDIKPENIILHADGSPVLVGFGAVQDPGSGVLAGTSGYMPPEQALGRVDPRSDLYALAATMLHALTHRPPLGFDARDDEGAQEIARLHVLAGIDPDLVAILERMLERAPDQRFSSARAVLEALEDPRRAEPTPPRPSLVLYEGSDRALAIAAAPRPITAAVRSRLDLVRALQTMNRRSLATLCAIAGASAIIGAMARVMWVVPLLLITVMIAFFAWPLRTRNTARALYARGDVARGKVLETREQGSFSLVAYRFDVGQHSYCGELATSESRPEASSDSLVIIFYDPNDPRRHTALLEQELREMT